MVWAASLGVLLSEWTSLNFCRQRSLTLIKDEAEKMERGTIKHWFLSSNGWATVEPRNVDVCCFMCIYSISICHFPAFCAPLWSPGMCVVFSNSEPLVLWQPEVGRKFEGIFSSRIVRRKQLILSSYRWWKTSGTTWDVLRLCKWWDKTANLNWCRIFFHQQYSAVSWKNDTTDSTSETMNVWGKYLRK